MEKLRMRYAVDPLWLLTNSLFSSTSLEKSLCYCKEFLSFRAILTCLHLQPFYVHQSLIILHLALVFLPFLYTTVEN